MAPLVELRHHRDRPSLWLVDSGEPDHHVLPADASYWNSSDRGAVASNEGGPLSGLSTHYQRLLALVSKKLSKGAAMPKELQRIRGFWRSSYFLLEAVPICLQA